MLGAHWIGKERAWIYCVSGGCLHLRVRPSGCFELYYFSGGYEPRQWLPIALWAGLPMPLTAWIGGKLARSHPAQRILTMGLGWDWRSGCSGSGTSRSVQAGTKALMGLIVVTMPAYQIALLAPTLMAMWLVGRRDVSASASDEPRGQGGGRA